MASNQFAKEKKNNFWVFRDGRSNVSSQRLFAGLETAIQELLERPTSPQRAINALLRAGELESALADIGAPAASELEKLTDGLASVLVGEHGAISRVHGLVGRWQQLSAPRELAVSPPEGFAYYALHPSEFANFARHVAKDGRNYAVIGIRTIGATLSAIVVAAVRHKGGAAQRITVRPTGHPYDRQTRFSAEQLRWVDQQKPQSAEFLIVDEGPGRSGSSFLSVGEALVSAGVEPGRIMFLGSRQIDATKLCARDAASRWSRFRFVSPLPTVYERFRNDIYIGGGDWRKQFLSTESEWPPCWPQMERLKFLSQDRKRLFKFEGFGRFGEEVQHGAVRLAEAGFGCAAEDAGDGMVGYSFIPGQLMRSDALSNQIVERIAQYCAFRASEFRSHQHAPSRLGEMLGFNLLHEFGFESQLDPELLGTTTPILVDGRMQPHEWIRRCDGTLLKVDACTHGNDHFFPGPTDIAWDLAGATVEWNLDADAADFLLARFQRLSGDDPQKRLPIFLLAYTVFRFAYCTMALSSVQESTEESVLEQARERYRSLIERQIAEARADSTHKPGCRFQPWSARIIPGKSQPAQPTRSLSHEKERDPVRPRSESL